MRQNELFDYSPIGAKDSRELGGGVYILTGGEREGLPPVFQSVSSAVRVRRRRVIPLCGTVIKGSAERNCGAV